MFLLSKIDEHILTTYIIEKISNGKIWSSFLYITEECGRIIQVNVYTSEDHAIKNYIFGNDKHCVQVIVLPNQAITVPRKLWKRKYSDKISFKKNGISKSYNLLLNIPKFSNQISYKYLTIQNMEINGPVYHREIEFPSNTTPSIRRVESDSQQQNPMAILMYKPRVLPLSFSVNLYLSDPELSRIVIRNYYMNSCQN